MSVGGGARFCALATVAAFWLVPVVRLVAAGTGNAHNLGSCSACHPTTPRFGIDAFRDVTFTLAADDPALCAPCHPAGQHAHPVLVDAGSGPPGGRVSTYLPAGTGAAFAGKIVCTTCHFVHAADSRHALLRGFPGCPDPRYFASGAAFCEECHGTNLKLRTAHGGGERSCGYCHAGRQPEGRAWEIAASLREPCALCHREVKDEHFDKADPFGAGGRKCGLCHARHAVSSASPGLLAEGYRAAAAARVRIRPHFRRTLCFTCHQNTDDYTLLNEDVNALCDRCHASGKIPHNIHPLRKVPPTIRVPKGWPLSDGALTCLTCHEQGHEDQAQRRWMLRGGPYANKREVCGNCHVKTDLESSKIHQKINAGEACELCHRIRPQPGKDTIKTVTFIAEPDLLCLRCHDQSAEDGTVHHSNMLGREIAAGHIPRELPLYQGRVMCATCHNPHTLESTGSRLRNYLAGTEFCLGCHPD